MHKKFVLRFSILLFAFLQIGCHSTRSLSGTKKIVKNIAQDEFLLDGYIGVYIINAKDSKPILALNEDQIFTPASTLKCLTLLESLRYFGDSLPVVKYAIYRDTLSIWGTGFPNFMEHMLDKNPLARADTEQTTSLVINFPATSACTKYGAGWAWDDAKYSFQKPLGSFPILGHYLNEKKSQQLSKLDPADKFNKGPFLPERKIFPNLFNKYYDQVFIDNEPIPKGVFTLNVPADSIYKRMMFQSDNFIADQLIIQRTMDEKNNCDVQTMLKEIKIQYPKLFNSDKIVDGSGLSRYNQLSPKSLVYIINEIDKIKKGETFQKHLPKIGTDILIDYQIPSETIIRGKTGSMSKVLCLTGKISKNNEIYYFAIMSNHFKHSMARKIEELGIFLIKITNLLQWK